MAAPTPGALLSQWLTLHWGTQSASINRVWRVTHYGPAADPAIAGANAVQWLRSRIVNIHGSGHFHEENRIYYLNDTPMSLWYEHDEEYDTAFGTDPPLPGMLTMLSSFRPDPAEPRRVSRLYWPFPRRSFLGTDGRPTPAAIAAAQTEADILKNPVNWQGGGPQVRVQPVVFHRDWGTHSDIITAVTSDYFATQRRRYRGKQREAWDTA